MDYWKNSIFCAMGVSLVFTTSAANAQLYVDSFTLTDFDGDGLMSDFQFVDAPSGNSPNRFGAGNELCAGAPCEDIQFHAGPIGVDTFTTGFNLGSGGIFQPMVTGTMFATIDTNLADVGDGQGLQFNALDFGGIYQDTITFRLGPDHLINCTGEAPGVFNDVCGGTALADDPRLSNPKGYNVEISLIDKGFVYGGDGGLEYVAANYNVVIQYVSTISDGTRYNGNEANFRLEGILHASDYYYVPVPASVWLFGSGFLGLMGVARKRRIQLRVA